MSTFKKAVFLINNDIADFDMLSNQVLNNQYSPADIEMPGSRFRGTLIKKSDKGIKLLGWQRDVSSLDGRALSFPSIITIEMDQDHIIRSAELHNSFRGGQGLLCNYQYLLNEIRLSYINAKMDEKFFRKITAKMLPCFHLVQVMAGILSSFQILQEKNLDYLFEEEVTDAYPDGKDLVLIGSQRMSFVNDPVFYTMVFRNGMDTFCIDETGEAVCAKNHFIAEFYLNESRVIDKEFAAMDDKLLDAAIKSLSYEGLINIKKSFTQDVSNSFMCSNLFPSTIKGLFVLSLVWRVYHNNISLIHHYTRMLRRSDNIPRCIGALDSIEEAKQYYPRFSQDLAIFSRLFA